MEKFQNLFDRANKNNWPYFLMATNNSYSTSIINKDNSIAYSFKTLYYSYCSLTYAKRELILAVNNEYYDIEDIQPINNKVIARSFAKAYRIPVIMGIGNKMPIVCRKDKRLTLEYNNLQYLIERLTGREDIKPFHMKKFHISTKNDNFYPLRQDFHHKAKLFGIDVIPVFIIETAIKHKKTAPWIEQLKIEVTNHRAKEYINSLVKKSLATLY